MSEIRLPYRDRPQAGQLLAEALSHYQGRPSLLVLALPRGGVPVAYEVAVALHAPLDVFVVRKLGFPGHEEYAMGAIASGGVRVMNPDPGLPVSDEAVERVAARELEELQRREELYRGESGPVPIAGKTVIIVDDGLATGATMRAAALAVRQQEPLHLCVAVPVGARQSVEWIQEVADEVVCPAMPEPFRAVGLWYRDFPQTGDEEVRRLLEQAHATH
jgi:putative phosphoribosyl transferase